MRGVRTGDERTKPRGHEQGIVAINPNIALARATPEGESEYRAFVAKLRQFWPDLEPIPKQPSLSKVDVKNGVWVVGHGDYHAETATYRTYRVFRQLFVPLAFLGAYRVYEAPRGGIVFIGRHPLPIWAQAWNAAIVGAACLVGYIALRGIMGDFR